MNNELYQLMITNAAMNCINNDTFVSFDQLDAFDISAVLAVCLAKCKEDIMADIVNRAQEILKNKNS